MPMHEPPGLQTPFATEDERADHLAQLLALDHRLMGLKSAGALPDSELQRSHIWATISVVPPVPGDSVTMGLRRWLSLFAEDIDSVHQARNRVVHSIWLSDEDLRTAVWLAEQLLGLLPHSGAGRPAAS